MGRLSIMWLGLRGSRVIQVPADRKRGGANQHRTNHGADKETCRNPTLALIFPIERFACKPTSMIISHASDQYSSKSRRSYLKYLSEPRICSWVAILSMRDLPALLHHTNLC